MADHGNITTADAGDLNTAARKYAASQGWAMEDGSYPIRPLDNHGKADLDKAVNAVGRGGGSHDAIRKHIIKRARALGLTDMIPDNWGSDGSLKERSGGDVMSDVERRYTTVPVEVRADGEHRRVGGYGAKFNIYSRNLGGFVEQVGPSFFNKSRGDGWPDVIARFNHDDNMLLGTTAGRTLQLSVDNIGLSYDVEPPASMRHVVEWIERGDVQKSSFAFRTIDDEWGVTEDGGPLRTLVSGILVDVAPVITPAYSDTTAGLRSLANRFDADLEEVRSLAEAGELRKFFVRTDEGAGAPKKPRVFGPSAAAELLARKQDPYA